VLANYDWDSKPLLSLVLVGLPELWGRLGVAKNRSLYSRIGTKLSLGEAKVDDTAEYLEYRLTRAGGKSTLFSSDAISLLHEAAHGRPRDRDRLATAALRHAAKRKLKIVDRELMVATLDREAPDHG
jgi:general secretion pathway protein A